MPVVQRKGEVRTQVEHIQEENSHSGRHKGGREVNTLTDRK